MPAPRQQRAGFPRRTVSANTPPVIPQLAPVVTLTSGSLVDLQFLAIARPPTDGGVAVPVILSGVPEVLRVLDTTFPTNAVLQVDGKTVRLTYSGVSFTSSDTLVMPPLDPSIRTATGGFAAPGTFGPPASPPTEIPYAVTSLGTLDAVVTFATGLANSITLAPASLLNLSTNTPIVALSCAGSVMTVTTTSANNPGDQWELQAPYVLSGSGALAVPARGIVVST